MPPASFLIYCVLLFKSLGTAHLIKTERIIYDIDGDSQIGAENITPG